MAFDFYEDEDGDIYKVEGIFLFYKLWRIGSRYEKVTETIKFEISARYLRNPSVDIAIILKFNLKTNGI